MLCYAFGEERENKFLLLLGLGRGRARGCSLCFHVFPEDCGGACDSTSVQMGLCPALEPGTAVLLIVLIIHALHLIWNIRGSPSMNEKSQIGSVDAIKFLKKRMCMIELW